MNVGIIVEGPDDHAVYKVLLKRINPAIQRVYPHECGGRHKLKNKFVPLLKVFEGNPAAYRLSKVIVIRDSDCQDPRPLEEEMRRTLDASGLQTSFEVAFHATKCKLESWLLADLDAISAVSASRGGSRVSETFDADLETMREADVVYRRVVRTAGLQDTSAVMGKIAEAASLERISERCPRFRDFRKKAETR